MEFHRCRTFTADWRFGLLGVYMDQGKLERGQMQFAERGHPEGFAL